MLLCLSVRAYFWMRLAYGLEQPETFSAARIGLPDLVEHAIRIYRGKLSVLRRQRIEVVKCSAVPLRLKPRRYRIGVTAIAPGLNTAMSSGYANRIGAGDEIHNAPVCFAVLQR